MSKEYESPELNKKAFTCPHCGAYAQMTWETHKKPNTSLFIKDIRLVWHAVLTVIKIRYGTMIK